MLNRIKKRCPNTRLVHWLADVHSAGFAPAFALSLCDSEYARNPPVPIAFIVSGNAKKIKQ